MKNRCKDNEETFETNTRFVVFSSLFYILNKIQSQLSENEFVKHFFKASGKMGIF